MALANKIVEARLIPYTRTLAQWTSENPIPNQGEIVIESGGAVMKVKCGDGVTHYLSLPYLFTGAGGEYLGMATTGTTPPGLTGTAYYFTVVNGTFTNLGGVTLPATSLLGIINFNGVSTWTATEILDTSAIGVQDFQSVLNNGALASQSSGAYTFGLLDSSNNNIDFTPTGITGKYPFAGVLRYFIGLVAGIPTLILRSISGGNNGSLIARSLTGARKVSFPDEGDGADVNSDLVTHKTKDPITVSNLAGTIASTHETNGFTTGSLPSAGNYNLFKQLASGWVYNQTISSVTKLMNIAWATLTANVTLLLPTWRSGTFAFAGTNVPPSIGPQSGAGVGATCVINVGDDNKGEIILTTGIGCGAADIFVLNYTTSYIDYPGVVLMPSNVPAAGVANQICLQSFLNGFQATSVPALADSTVYKWNYIVIV